MSEKFFRSFLSRRNIGLFAGPAAFVIMILIPVPENMDPEAWNVASIAVFMAIWWVSEAVPIPVTALLPIIFFPVLNVMEVSGATQPFANPLIYLFMGGFIIALAMEKTNLHKRVALRIVQFVGTSPEAIVVGFMGAAAFLSMWVSNTATAMMMLPIALSLIELVEKNPEDENGELETNFAIVLLLSLAYACNIGGIATLIGTPPNALMAGFMLDNYDVDIGFGQWMLVGMPVVIVALPLVYLVLTRIILPINMKTIPGGRKLIVNELAKMGMISREEKMVGSVFLLTATLWIVRPLLETYIPNISDTGIAIFGAVMMFLLPVRNDNKELDFVLKWDDAKRLPWEILILFGGGLSLAAGITETGLAEWVGESLAGLEFLHISMLIILSLTTVIFLTEITSNTATAAAFIPILASVAISMGYDPLILAVPAAIGASCAFMLPVATPPNAIVFGSNMLSIPQMAKVGVVFNFFMVFVITFVLYITIGYVFGVEFGL